MTLGFCIGFGLDLSPWLRGPVVYPAPGWQWGYRPDALIQSRLILVVLSTVALLIWYRVAGSKQRVGYWMLLLLIVLGLVFQMSLLSSRAGGLQIFSRVLNPAYFGYYPPAAQVDDLGTFIGDYADNQADYIHPRLQTHPPGNVVFHYAILKSVEAFPILEAQLGDAIQSRAASLPDWINDYSTSEIIGGILASLIIPSLTVAAVIPLYLLARESHSEEAAQRVALLYLFLPAIILFQPKIDTLYTLIAALAISFAYLGSVKSKGWMLYLSGLICSVGLFMSYSLAPLCVVVGGFVLVQGTLAWRRREITLKTIFLHAGLTLLGGVSIQFVTWILFGFDPIQSFVVMQSRSNAYNMGLSYGYSLIYVPYDVLLFAGIPASLLTLSRLISLVKTGIRDTLAPIDILFSVSTGVFALLVISGIQRAETARILLYMMPGIVFFAGLEMTDRHFSERAFLVIGALMIIQLFVFHMTLEVFV